VPTLAQIRHFFEHYKDLEAGKWVKVEGWAGPDAARAEMAAWTPAGYVGNAEAQAKAVKDVLKQV